MKVMLAFLLATLFTFCSNGQPVKWPHNTVYDIFPGDYADPSILRDGNDFYMTHSTTSLLIWHSTDLLHWTPIGRALPAYSRDVWAPELVKHNGRFFIYYPQRGKIFVVWAEKITGPWSEPVPMAADGIDPGVVNTPEGKRYMYLNAGTMVALDQGGLSTSGQPLQVYTGWQYPAYWAVECFCLESPKLIFHNGYYYMISAQGGTSGPATSHMAVLARSKLLEGPWENSPYNPVVHTWGTGEAYASKGHGTIFSDAQGQWYIVYHAYQKGQLPLGRHTLIEPVKWTDDGWLVSAVDKAQKISYRMIENTAIKPDNFNGKTLGMQWNPSGFEGGQDYTLSTGTLTLRGTSGVIKSMQLITADHAYETTVKLTVTGDAEAGLAAYYDGKSFVGLAINNGLLFAVRDNQPQEPSIAAVNVKYLKIKMDQYNLTLQYSTDGIKWVTYPSAYELSGYQTNVLRNFGSLRPSIFIKGEGEVVVQDFKYSRHL